MQKMHPKIAELKKRAAPIQYSTTTINAKGDVETFNSLLLERKVRGYGCIWGVRNGHNERFHKGAFKRSIQENGPKSGAAYEIKFRDEHNRAMALFEVLKEDEIGLYFETKPLDNVPWADDFLEQVRTGTINNFSNGFNYVFARNAMVWNEKEELIDMYEAKLMEISGVSIPSDQNTFVLRSQEEQEELFEDTEAFIKTIPRAQQLELRKLIARHKSQNDYEAYLQERDNHIDSMKPNEKGLDYNYLLQKLKK